MEAVDERRVVFVGGFDDSMSECYLMKRFTKFGAIENLKVFRRAKEWVVVNRSISWWVDISIESVVIRFKFYRFIKFRTFLFQNDFTSNCKCIIYSDGRESYAFIYFIRKADANKAIEEGNIGESHQLQLSFGGRRKFCKQRYRDLGLYLHHNSKFPLP